jgi:hypothetical protein
MRSLLDATTLTDLEASSALMHLIDRGYVQRP